MPHVKTVQIIIRKWIFSRFFVYVVSPERDIFVYMSNVNKLLFFSCVMKLFRGLLKFSRRDLIFLFDVVRACLRWSLYWKFRRVCFWKWIFFAAILNLFVSLMIFISGNSTLYIVVCFGYLASYLVFCVLYVYKVIFCH